MRWLIEHGVKVNYEVDGVRRCLALSSATVKGHLDVVKLLVEEGGADVTASWAGQNALLQSIMYDKKDIEAYLRSKGANLPEDAMKEERSCTSPVLEHIAAHLGKPSPLAVREILPSSPSIMIHSVPMKDCVALVTEGMSAHPMTTPPGAEQLQYGELVIYLPRDWPLTPEALGQPEWNWPIAWLRRIALFPHQNKTWLGGPFAMFSNGEPPAPLAPNTDLCSLLVMPPVSEAFRSLRTQDGHVIMFYTVLPLYREERDLFDAQGPEGLFPAFENAGVSHYVDISRPNAVTRGSERP